MHRSLWVVLGIAVLVCPAALHAQTCATPVITQIGGSNPSCANASVTLDAGPGATYLWSTGATTRIISDAPSITTTYTVTVTQADGCSVMSAPLEVQVVANPQPPAITLAATGDACPNTQNYATVSGTWSSIEWSIANGTFNTDNHAATVGFIVGASGTTTVTVTVSDTNGCTTTPSTNVNVLAVAPPVIVVDQGQFCTGGFGRAHLDMSTILWSGAEFTIRNGYFRDPYTGAFTAAYVWGTSVDFQADGNGPVELSVQATAGAGGCSMWSTTMIPLRTTTPTAVIQFDRTAACAGSDVNATVAPPAEGSWGMPRWSVTNGTFVSETNPDGTSSRMPVTVRADGTGPLTLSLAISDSFGCSTTATAQLPLRTIDPPAMTFTKPSVCPGSYVSAQISDPAEGYWSSIHWTIQNATFGDGSTEVDSNVNWDGHAQTFCPYAAWATGAGPVRFTATARDNYGCTTSVSGEVPIRTIPPPSISFSVPAVCAGSYASAQITNPAEGYWLSIHWTIQNATFGDGSTEVDSNVNWQDGHAQTFCPYAAWASGAGPVRFTATARDNYGCTTSVSGEVPIRTIPPPSISFSVPAVCAGSYASAQITNPAEGYWLSIHWTIQNATFGDGSTEVDSNVNWQDGHAQTFCPYAAWANGAGPVRFTATARDNYGCTTSVSGEVPLRTIARPAMTFSKTSVCPGSSVQAQITNPAEGSWLRTHWTVINGTFEGGTTEVEFTVTPTVIATGNGPVQLTVTATDTFGCTVTATGEVPIRTIDPPAITFSRTSVCAGSSVQAQVGNPAEGSWALTHWSVVNGTFEGGGTEVEATLMPVVIATGNGPVQLTITATDNLGCSVTTSAEVPIRMIPAPTITFSQPAVCPGGSVQAQLGDPAEGWWADTRWTVINGTFQGGSTEVVATTMPIAIANGAGPLLLTVTATDSLGCTATGTGQVAVETVPVATITASGPTTFCSGGSVTLTVSAAASYLWSNGATTQSITVTESGSYGVTVTAASGCTATSTPVSVTVNPLPIAAITAGGPTMFCAGGSVSLAGSAAASYLWSNGETTQSIVATTSGVYTVTLTDVDGCSTTSDPVTITVLPKPPATITASGATTFCAGGSVMLIAPAGSGYSYAWSTGEQTQAIVVTSSGNYAVTVTNADGCSTTSAPTTVTVNPLPAATMTATGPTTFCQGGSVTLTASPSASYLWSNGATTQSIMVSQSGSYSVRVTTAAGCSATSPATAVTVSPLPQATITAGGPTTFCDGGRVTLNASSGASYLWSNGATTQWISVTQSGDYTVTVTNSSGCSTTSAPTTVTVNPLPPAAITADGATEFCQSGSVTLTASPGASYLWSNGATTQSITVSEGGLYSVRVTNENGCSTTSSLTGVVVHTPPDPTVIADGPTTFCGGGSVYLHAPSAGYGTTYLWSTGATTQGISVTQSGNYSVTVTSPYGCTAASSATVVNVLPAATATITASGPQTFCPGQSVTFTATPGASYLWSSGATTQSITVSETGSYSVTVTNDAGCSATSAAANVYVFPPAPVAEITVSGPTTFCDGGNVVLSGGAAPYYLWSNGSTDRAILVTQSGTYTVTMTDNNGCSSTSAPVTVTVNPMPDATITADGPTSFCDGGSVTLSAPAGYTYSWSNGATTQSITVSQSGTFTVNVTTESGCSATSQPLTVTVNANPPAPTISVGGPTTFCQGGSVTLTAPYGYSYLWSTGETTQSINATATAAYSVTIANASGCPATSAPVNVTVNPATTITQQPQSVTIPKNTTTKLTVVASGTGTLSYQWYQGQSGNTSKKVGTNSPAFTTPKLTIGTYYYWVKVTSSCGTMNSNTATVTSR